MYCTEYIFLNDNPSDIVLLIYPFELCNEEILRNNIKYRVKKILREYINEIEQYNRCMNTISKLFFDAQKEVIQNEADKHQQKADELSEVMNDGINPYAWYVKKNFDHWIDGVHYKARYVVYLDKI